MGVVEVKAREVKEEIRDTMSNLSLYKEWVVSTPLFKTVLVAAEKRNDAIVAAWKKLKPPCSLEDFKSLKPSAILKNPGTPGRKGKLW